MLKLVGGEFEVRVCPKCKGSRKVLSEKRICSNGRLAPGHDCPMPCPDCRGSGTVIGGGDESDPGHPRVPGDLRFADALGPGPVGS